ncbi:hypothetical protein HHL22_07265 [Hymenobacter sp. RP-2-7]|uniref:Uncharacterized protein n=1 Tax=Hymenobacter polaris TaxID=2682546 RepID=A0A7Y0ACU4_9BACT|nr:hypothetical protein [Hymenobacter polaris]NML65003.1 hypothetical protein [Hymenobacter polaris]
MRWLLWGWAAVLPLTLLLPPLHLGWLLPVYYLAVFGPLVFYSALLRQPAWVQVDPDCITWANPADGPVVGYQFADLRAYRFEWTKNDNKLLLYPREGAKIVLSGRFHKEFWTMEEAFKQAIRRYNQAHPGAEIAQEPDALEKYFTSPLATKVLWALLALGAAAVAWGISHDAPGPAYLPLLLIGLPYLLVWANFYYERP